MYQRADHITTRSNVLPLPNGPIMTLWRMTSIAVHSFLPLQMSLVQPVHHICFSNHVPHPSTLGNLHDNHILYPIIKVLYALHTLLERIAASKTLESERERKGELCKEEGNGGYKGRERTDKEIKD